LSIKLAARQISISGITRRKLDDCDLETLKTINSIIAIRRLLLGARKPVRLGSRALDILIAVAERAGEMVSKDELAAHVWQDTIVDMSLTQKPSSA